MTTALTTTNGTTELAMYAPDAVQATMAMAKSLVASRLTPRGVDTAEKAFYIIMKGRELGVPPIRSLERIHIIEGKCTMASELMLERFRQRGGRSNWPESTNKKAVLWLKAPNGDEHTEEFTWEDAQAAGVTGKDNWKRWPKAMLRARAISAGLRAMGEAEGLYDPDELGAVTNEEGQVVAVEGPKAVVASIAAKPAEPVAEADSSVTATSEVEYDPTTGEVLDAELADESDEEDLTDVVPCHVFNERSQQFEYNIRSEPKLSPRQLKHIQVLRGKLGHHLDNVVTDGGVGVSKKSTRVKDGKYRKKLLEKFGKEHTNELSRREATLVIDLLLGMVDKVYAKLDRGNEAVP